MNMRPLKKAEINKGLEVDFVTHSYDDKETLVVEQKDYTFGAKKEEAFSCRYCTTEI